MKNRPEIKGIILVLISNLAFCCMAVLIRYASSISTYTTALFRFGVGLALLGSMAMLGRTRLEFVNKPLLLLRGLFGGIAVFIFYLSIVKLGIGKGSVILYSYPVFAAIFGIIFLKERVRAMKMAAVGLALAGIYVLTAFNGHGLSQDLSFGKYEIAAVLGAVLAGVTVVIIKRLHDTDSTPAIFFAQCLVGFWMVIIPAVRVQNHIGYTGCIVLLAIGLIAALGQLLMTEGFKYVTATTGALLGMLIPVMNFTLGVLFFGESMTLFAVAGTLMVIAACLIIIGKPEN
jgi:drug/metabolite transporter (DMT)-like permease